jgi:hypothetical protein
VWRYGQVGEPGCEIGAAAEALRGFAARLSPVYLVLVRWLRAEEKRVSDSEYFVLIRPGDATREVEEALRDLRLPPEAAGLHRHFFVTRARQTVVMATGPDAPISARLMARGWSVPGTDA